MNMFLPANFAFWNSQGFFGALQGDHHRQLRKRTLASKLFNKIGVIAILEAHGCVADLEAFQLDQPHCTLAHSARPMPLEVYSFPFQRNLGKDWTASHPTR